MVRWASIHGSKPLCEVSTEGEIRRCSDPSKVRKAGTSYKGYSILKLRFTGVPIPVTKSVHSLVATAFLDKPAEATQVNHIDGNKQNNSLSNLEWVTPSQNVKHSYDLGLRRVQRDEKTQKHTCPRHMIDGAQKGAKNYNAKLTLAQVQTVKAAQNTSVKGTEIARQLGVSKSAIYAIWKTRRWNE